MSHSDSFHKNRHLTPSANVPSSNNNNNNNLQQQPQIINLESESESDDDDDDDDDEEVVLLKNLPPPPPRQTSSAPALSCLVKTDGPLDYQDDCFCLKCRMIKDFLVKHEFESDCTCAECLDADAARQDDASDPQQQSQVSNGNEVTHPQTSFEPTNNSQPEALSPENDDDRYSKCSTPDYMPRFFSDDDDDDDEEEEEDNDDEEENPEKEEVQMDQSESEATNDVSSSDFEPILKKPTSSTASNKKSKKKNKKNKTCTKANECPLCKSILSSSMSIHYRVVHLGWKPYYCRWTKCSFTSGYLNALETHIKLKHFKRAEIQHNIKDYVGKRVDSQPPTDKLLSEYLLKTTGHLIPITSSYIEPNALKSECPKCGRPFSNAFSLEIHLESHGNAGFRCSWPNCGQFYSTFLVTKAKLHICRDHLNTGAEYSYNDMKEAKKYLQPVSADNSVEASSSSATLDSESSTSLNPTHRDSDNEDDNDDDHDYEDDSSDSDSNPNMQLKCPHCPKSFPTKWRYDEHVFIHSGKKPFGCSRCSFKTNRESNVSHHYRIVHKGKKLFRCTFADCGFVNSVFKDICSHIRTEHRTAFKYSCWKKVIGKYVEKRYLAPK